MLHLMDVYFSEYDVKMDLISGKPYYIMIEACNSLLQCTQVISKALIGDDSPPMAGLVRLGHSDYHTIYFNSRSVIFLTCHAKFLLHWSFIHSVTLEHCIILLDHALQNISINPLVQLP